VDSKNKPQKQSFDLQGNLVVAFLKLLGLLPILLAGKLGRALGHLVWLTAGTSKKVTLRNIELCLPELSAEEQYELAKESILETIATIFEVAPAWVQPAEKNLKYITHVDNEHLLKQALEQKRGVVLIVPHFGNWEIANHFMAHKYSLLAMYKPVDLPALDDLIYKSRSQLSEMVAADRRGVVALFSAMKAGKITGVLPDQEPALQSGVWVPFFGIPALTPKLVSKLTNETNAVAMGYGCQRNADGKGFHIFFEAVDDDMYSKDLEVSAAAMNRCVERIIRRDPTQYQWEYKRFKRRPDNQPNPYS